MTGSRPLDRIDRELLRLLQKDARRTNKELAAEVGLAPSSTLARVQRLVADGVLRGFHADVDPGALGVGLQAMVHLRLAQCGRRALEELLEHLLATEGVVEILHVSGPDDLLVRVAARDTAHLRRIVLDEVTGHSEIRHVETSVVFEHVRGGPLPTYS